MERLRLMAVIVDVAKGMVGGQARVAGCNGVVARLSPLQLRAARYNRFMTAL